MQRRRLRVFFSSLLFSIKFIDQTFDLCSSFCFPHLCRLTFAQKDCHEAIGTQISPGLIFFGERYIQFQTQLVTVRVLYFGIVPWKINWELIKAFLHLLFELCYYQFLKDYLMILQRWSELKVLWNFAKKSSNMSKNMVKKCRKTMVQLALTPIFWLNLSIHDLSLRQMMIFFKKMKTS